MTSTVALIGDPVAHSISPRFQQAALDALGLDVRYEAWETPAPALPAAVERLRSAQLLGANVTVPHKVAVMRLTDRPDPLAEMVGAANTITRRDGLLYATNTDVAGVLRALEEGGVEVAGRRVLLLGAGGAARAVVVAMRRGHAAALTIANRTVARAEALVALGGEELATESCALEPSSEALRAALEGADLVIHSTPLGMRHGPDERATALPAEVLSQGLRPGQVAFDLVYVPEQTPFLAAAARGGARTLGGLTMLIHQGAESFRLWTGHEPPLDVMFQAARAALAAPA